MPGFPVLHILPVGEYEIFKASGKYKVFAICNYQNIYIKDQ